MTMLIFLSILLLVIATTVPTVSSFYHNAGPAASGRRITFDPPITSTRLFGFRTKTKQRFKRWLFLDQKSVKDQLSPSWSNPISVAPVDVNRCAENGKMEVANPGSTSNSWKSGLIAKDSQPSIGSPMWIEDNDDSDGTAQNVLNLTTERENKSDEILEESSAPRHRRIFLPCNRTTYIQLPHPDWLNSKETTIISHTPKNPTTNEFRDSIAHFADRYTERDIALLKSTRLRIVMEGMAATVSSRDKMDDNIMYRAFEILYQDILPLRVAGRFIFRRLRHVMARCKAQRSDEIDQLWQQSQPTANGTATGIFEWNNYSREDFEAAQFYFLLLIESVAPTLTTASHHDDGEDVGIHNDSEHDTVLDLCHLEASGAAEMLANKLELPDSREIISCIDPNGKGQLEFHEFMIGLQNCCRASSGETSSEGPVELLEDLVLELSEATSINDHNRNHTESIHLIVRASNRRNVLDEKRQGYSTKFDDMLDAFAGWEDRIPTEPGRMLDVLRGCFVGARNEQVREALRIVYMDVPPMRVAGNTIFALMSALIRRRPEKK